MIRILTLAVIVFALAACNRQGDQPENSTDAAPSDAAPSETTADTVPPTANGSADAVTSGSPDAAGETQAIGDPAAPMVPAGEDTLAQGDDLLQGDLARCDGLAVAEQAACRSDAHSRYSQRAAGGTGDGDTPVQTP